MQYLQVYMQRNIDFLAIGDVVIDAFIRLKDATVHCDVDTKACKLCVDFGSKVPYEFVEVVPAVGNSANAAVAAARLGLTSALVASVGNDANGLECINHLHKDHVITDFIKVQEGKKTNYHYVLWYEDERTILIKHEPFEYKLPDFGTPRFIYLSSLGEEAFGLHRDIVSVIKNNPDIKLAFQPGTFQIKLGAEKIKEVYENAYVFFCNVEEARIILGKEFAKNEVIKLLEAIAALGPKIVVITDGRNGAYLYDNSDAYFMPPYPDPKAPYERTGAGDAFSSTFVSALALGLAPHEAIMWAPINSMSVVQQIGAQKGLLKKEDLLEFLKHAPETYRLKKIS